MKSLKKSILTAAGAFLLTGGAVQAQVEQPAAPPMPEQQAASVSQGDIEKFAQIYVQVEETRSELALEMNDAATPEQAQEIQARMQQEIVAAIDDHGWSVDKYNEVATAISNDDEMRSRALDLINELSS
ncbi:MAG: DUF4168 domain-containing protein [Woeseia sp.]